MWTIAQPLLLPYHSNPVFSSSLMQTTAVLLLCTYIANQTFAFPAARYDETQHRCEDYWFFERLLPNVRILLLPKKTSSQEDVSLGEDCVSDMRCPYCRHVRPPLH
ncbi:hypothetical protein E4U37_007095 [Claviceps purpurea]|nr:hypothetical protein E4U37_007095 [Claviceps purpurea]